MKKAAVYDLDEAMRKMKHNTANRRVQVCENNRIQNRRRNKSNTLDAAKHPTSFAQALFELLYVHIAPCINTTTAGLLNRNIPLTTTEEYFKLFNHTDEGFLMQFAELNLHHAVSHIKERNQDGKCKKGHVQGKTSMSHDWETYRRHCKLSQQQRELKSETFAYSKTWYLEAIKMLAERKSKEQSLFGVVFDVEFDKEGDCEEEDSKIDDKCMVYTAAV